MPGSRPSARAERGSGQRLAQRLEVRRRALEHRLRPRPGHDQIGRQAGLVADVIRRGRSRPLERLDRSLPRRHALTGIEDHHPRRRAAARIGKLLFPPHCGLATAKAMSKMANVRSEARPNPGADARSAAAGPPRGRTAASRAASARPRPREPVNHDRQRRAAMPIGMAQGWRNMFYPARSTKNPPNVCKYGTAVDTRR